MIIVRKGVETQLSVLRTVSNPAQCREATDTEIVHYISAAI